jgi:hypothetical protein
MLDDALRQKAIYQRIAKALDGEGGGGGGGGRPHKKPTAPHVDSFGAMD